MIRVFKYISNITEPPDLSYWSSHNFTSCLIEFSNGLFPLIWIQFLPRRPGHWYRIYHEGQVPSLGYYWWVMTHLQIEAGRKYLSQTIDTSCVYDIYLTLNYRSLISRLELIMIAWQVLISLHRLKHTFRLATARYEIEQLLSLMTKPCTVTRGWGPLSQIDVTHVLRPARLHYPHSTTRGFI